RRPTWRQDSLRGAHGDGPPEPVVSDHGLERSHGNGACAADGRGGRYGIAGVGARFPLLLSRGLARGMPVERLAEVACANPARAFGHYPRKGVIAPGSDADLLIWDPGGGTIITAGSFGAPNRGSVYSG